jgi:transposase
MNGNEQSSQNKSGALKNSGTLNPSPESVKDPIFQNNDFFDPRDIVQVKYEMLRRVQIERASVSDTVKSFGFSRLSYYRIVANFKEFGLCGLIPQKRGPKQAHKLNPEILEFMDEQIKKNPSIKSHELKIAIEKKFGLFLHARTLDRALIKKKRSIL